MTAALGDDSVPEIAPGYRFQWEQAQDCYVILYPEGMVRLSASAGEILKRVDGAASISAIAAALGRTYPGAELAADVHRFLEVARGHGWIRVK